MERAAIGAMVWLMAFVGWLIYDEFFAPKALEKMDELAAKQAKDAMRESGRLRVRGEAEWSRRLKKKWLAYGRAGEANRVKMEG
jgi:hypothetical protein